ncbi:MAG: type II toxin-antitoxin system RelE/ParE family toxin [Nitratireductor sp.]|nr:type II toxin-antitoxin system RelE/ParE family toxin [Nitratireductor sp.]MCB1455316.1 type II toxin-antitoxin system RelE/ParE family toxin [Nitratireductor sp.]MCB1459709.1 type II toxin-antitoxin system RelE/ParE family toxin [Nitratireductor sp.]
MVWKIEFVAAFKAEFDEFPEAAQDAILAHALVLERQGPILGRPYVDTLKDSRHANMKELRCTAEKGVWRVAFAFDPDRKAILLTAGNKAGANQKRFYKQLIATADDRFDLHLAELERKRK